MNKADRLELEELSNCKSVLSYAARLEVLRQLEMEMEMEIMPQKESQRRE